jgi:hypothetical protein
MTPLKRKVSCTFKRETPLEVQERIYMLVWLPAPDGLVPLLVQEGIEGWSPDLGVVGASGPHYGVRRLDAAFAARRSAPRHRPGARLPKCKAEAELPHSKGRAKTTRGVEMPQG